MSDMETLRRVQVPSDRLTATEVARKAQSDPLEVQNPNKKLKNPPDSALQKIKSL